MFLVNTPCVKCGRTVVADVCDPAPVCPQSICADPLTLLSGIVYLPDRPTPGDRAKEEPMPGPVSESYGGPSDDCPKCKTGCMGWSDAYLCYECDECGHFVYDDSTIPGDDDPLHGEQPREGGG